MPKQATGIDIGARTAIALRGRIKDSSFAVTGYGLSSYVAPPSEQSEVVEVGWAELSLPFKLGEARVGVSGRDVNIRYMRVPRVPDWQLRKLMSFEVEEIGGQSGAEVASDFNVLPELPEIEDEDVVLLGMALCCDGLYGPYQNYLKKKHKDMKGLHLMLNVNLWEGQLAAAILTFGYLHSDGGPCELRDALDFVSRHPEVVPKLGVVMVTMAIGCLFIFNMQMGHGALTVTLTTTVRKLISILFSVLWFGHAMAPVQWVAVMIVFTARPMGGFLAGLFGYGPGTDDKKEGRAESKKTK